MKPVFVLVFTALLGVPAVAADLPQSAPEAQGVSSAGVLAFVAEADRKVAVMNSFMLVRHGHVVAEGWWGPYDAKSRHELYSLSKSFTSTAVGMAIAEGKLNLHDPVLKFFPEDAPTEPSNNLKAMRVFDLLRMSAGHQAEVQLAASKDPWTKAFLAHEVRHKPGTHFVYNTPATYMASAIVQKVTGQTVLDYLKPRLFEPLGIEQPTWGMSPQGVSLGGYGLSIRTEDIAKFGQLYLQKGKWGDKQLVPADWVDLATARQTSNGSSPNSDWDQGYGFQFWRCRHNAFRGDGAHGQFCVVLPEQDAVVAITAGTRDLQGVLNVVWDKLLPALKAEALPTDEASAKALKEKLAGLTIPMPKAAANARVPAVSGKTFSFPANDQKIESLRVEVASDGGVSLVATMNGKADQKIACGKGTWSRGKAVFGSQMEQPIAAYGAWTADNVYTAKVCLYETPFLATLALDFGKDGQVTMETSWNVARPNLKSGPIVGVVK